jgi:hypothetical protein
MSTQFTITVTAIFPFTFIGPIFTGDIDLNPNAGGSPFNNQVFTILTPTTASITLSVIVPAGPRTISLKMIPITAMTSPSYPPPNDTPMANFQVSFNSSPPSLSTVGTVSRNGSNFGSNNVGGMTATVNVACIHGSSLIQMRNGTKRLDEIEKGDEVLSGTNLNEYAKVKDIAKCWLSFLGTDHDAIIFEPYSVGNNKHLIIDPGHPMCTQEEYLKEGYDALRPAGTYWEEENVQVITKKWTDIFVQSEPSIRYDLILETPYNIYIANGVVVRAKGYRDHRYKQFV